MERSVRSYRLCTERCLSWQKGSLFQTMEGIDTNELPPLNHRILKGTKGMRVQCRDCTGGLRRSLFYTVSPLGQ